MKHLKYFKEHFSLITEKKYLVYHGTDSVFTEFDYSKQHSNTDAAWNGSGFYFSDTPAEAKLYGSNLMKVEITLNNPFRLDLMEEDSSVWGSGLVKLFAHTEGLKDLKYEGKTIHEIYSIVCKLEKEYANIRHYLYDGLNANFKNIGIEYDGEDYDVKNKAKTEYENPKHLKQIIISSILDKKYNITLPQRISDIVSPRTFSNILQENGYDGVIAPNSTVFHGLEYVVFDKKNIKILNNKAAEMQMENYYSFNTPEMQQKKQQKRVVLTNTIKTFNDITEEVIPDIIEVFGFEGFDSKESALEFLHHQIEFYQEMPDPVTLYRVVAVKDKNEIKTSELGDHYISDYNHISQGNLIDSIATEEWNDKKVYVLQVSVPVSQIDVFQTLIQNLSFPNEQEITLKNKGKGAKLIDVFPYYEE